MGALARRGAVPPSLRAAPHECGDRGTPACGARGWRIRPAGDRAMILDRIFGAPGPQRLALKALSLMEPETAHRATLAALMTGLAPKSGIVSPRLATRLCGLDLLNPLGMAAGFDKNGEVPDTLIDTGFGFVEVGTVTPRPQEGNPRPRLFRLPEAGGVINRMGFNNEGHEAVYERLARRTRKGVVGVNIGANKDS